MGAPQSIPRRPISVREYHKMIDAGVFHEDDRVDLIEGELIQTSPIGGPHIQLVNLLVRTLDRQLGDDGIVSVQNPVAFPPDSEPESDIVVLRPECLHRTEVPSAADVVLIVEVSHSTLAYDRDVKIPLYARHGIPEVWIFETITRSVSIYCEPSRNSYLRLLTPDRSESISPSLLPKVQLQLCDIWR